MSSTPLQRVYRFCRGDGSLTIAVFILIFFAFVLYPMIEVGVVRRVWLDIVFAAFLAMGAIGSYLLIGIVFTQAYRLLAGFIPGAFAIGGAAADYDTISQRLSYFSFITLTSTGYGDITPVHPYARSLATMEALAGNLFLAVLVARLVGQEIDWRHEQRDLRRAEAAAKRQKEDRSSADRGL